MNAKCCEVFLKEGTRGELKSEVYLRGRGSMPLGENLLLSTYRKQVYVESVRGTGTSYGQVKYQKGK
jgi:hypothetical protein